MAMNMYYAKRMYTEAVRCGYTFAYSRPRGREKQIR